MGGGLRKGGSVGGIDFAGGARVVCQAALGETHSQAALGNDRVGGRLGATGTIPDRRGSHAPLAREVADIFISLTRN